MKDRALLSLLCGLVGLAALLWTFLGLAFISDRSVAAALAVLPEIDLLKLALQGFMGSLLFACIVVGTIWKIVDYHERKIISLITGVAHDIKSPIATIRGYLETILLKYDSMEEAERKAFLATAFKRSELLSEVVIDLLELLDPSKLRTPLERKPFSLSSVVERAVTQFNEVAKAKQIKIEINSEPGDMSICGDERLIERAATNIIGNAVRYSHNKSTVRVSLAAKKIIRGRGETDFSVIFKVQDHGVGINRAEMRRIFTRFFRGSLARVNEPKGSGLGLAIVKNVIEAHNGKVTLKSYPYCGTTVEVSLPLYDSSQRRC